MLFEGFKLKGSLRIVEPPVEVGAFEELWLRHGASTASITKLLKNGDGKLQRPSAFVERELAIQRWSEANDKLASLGCRWYSVRVAGAGDYPSRLYEARNPQPLLYYRGFWDLVDARIVAVVGTRKPSPEGTKRAHRVARELAEAGYIIASGLADGVDTAAHNGALGVQGGRTIAVIGTHIGRTYPKQNEALQERIANDHLLISQVPVLRYENQGPHLNRFFFPERNATMSALASATVIVEAGESSGTLTQARAALQQGRLLFILDSCFESGLEWPRVYEKKGAIRVRSTDEIIRHLRHAETERRWELL